MNISAQRYFNIVTAGCMIIVAVFINLVESIYGRSLRFVFTTALTYYFISGLMINGFVLTRKSFYYILFVMVYVLCFYAFGSGNNLIVHLLTLCLGTVLFYNSLLASNYDIDLIWRFAVRVWQLIYLTLALELMLVALGFQGFLYETFPEINRSVGLPAYRSLFNTFANFFQLGFDGLNSITLQAQAYGQFCVMLSILGFSYTTGTFKKGGTKNFIIYAVAPVLLFVISPNMTPAIILLLIIAYVLLIKLYLKIHSRAKFVTLMCLLFGLTVLYYSLDSGLINKYQQEDVYNLFIGKQIEYIASRSYGDYLIGVGLGEYYEVAPEFEISLLSYLSVSGLIFGVVNLAIFYKFTSRTLRQIKMLYINNLANRKIIEIQIMNLIFVVAMLVSAMHFPVVTSYLGSLIFIFHLSFGLYMLKINRDRALIVN